MRTLAALVALSLGVPTIAGAQTLLDTAAAGAAAGNLESSGGSGGAPRAVGAA